MISWIEFLVQYFESRGAECFLVVWGAVVNFHTEDGILRFQLHDREHCIVGPCWYQGCKYPPGSCVHQHSKSVFVDLGDPRVLEKLDKFIEVPAL